MIPAEYWLDPHSPQRNSPVGKIMRQLEILYPEVEADLLREMARDRVNTAGPGQARWSREERQRLKEWAESRIPGPLELFSDEGRPNG